MKCMADSKKGTLVQQISESARAVEKLARQAVRLYADEVEAIVTMESTDSQRIERCLDGMLGFCFDSEMLALYKRLCHYYFEIDPESTTSYVNIYRDMWDEQT